jgi:hypothetical protein
MKIPATLGRAALRAAVVSVYVASLTACGAGSKPDGFGEHGHEDMLIASTAAGGGQLTIEYDFTQAVETSESATIGGTVLFSATDPGFAVLEEDEPDEGLFVIPEEGVSITVEVTAVDEGASMKLGDAILDAVGESAVLGASHEELHVHPEWGLALPEGVVEDRTIAFKLTTDAPEFEESESFTVTLTPVEE